MRRLVLALLGAAALVSGAHAEISYLPHVPPSLDFSGGPLVSLAAGTGNNSLTNGAYGTADLNAGAISGATGAQATFLVTGCDIGTCSVAATVIDGGAAISTTGGNGYIVGETVSINASTFLGVGSVSFTVLTTAPFVWTPSFGIATLGGVLVGSGGGGGGGQAGGVTAGGGGGGSGAWYSMTCQPIHIAAGTPLTITPGQPGLGGTPDNDGGDGGSTSITGALTSVPAIIGGFGGKKGAAGVGGAGGTGATVGQGIGGAAGAAGFAPAALLNPCYSGGAGGGGGGSTATVPGAGGGTTIGPFGGTAVSTDLGGGGGGAKNAYGDGGRGGNRGTNGGRGANGSGGGGGGGGSGGTGSNGTAGRVSIVF